MSTKSSSIYFLTSKILGNSPAAVNMRTGRIALNSDLWDQYDAIEQDWIINHELGHYKYASDDELIADNFATKKTNIALSKVLKILKKIGANQERINNINKQIKNNKDMMRQSIGNSPFVPNKAMSYADGGGTTENNQTDEERRQAALALMLRSAANNTPSLKTQKKGIVISDFYLSFEVIALVAVAVVLFLKLK